MTQPATPTLPAALASIDLREIVRRLDLPRGACVTARIEARPTRYYIILRDGRSREEAEARILWAGEDDDQHALATTVISARAALARLTGDEP